MKHLGLWAIVCGTALAGGAVVSGVAVADSLQVQPAAAQHLAVSGVSTEPPTLGVTTVTVSDDTTAKKPVKEVPPSDPVKVDPKKKAKDDDPAKHECDGMKRGADDPTGHPAGEHEAWTSGTTGFVHHHRHGGFGH